MSKDSFPGGSPVYWVIYDKILDDAKKPKCKICQCPVNKDETFCYACRSAYELAAQINQMPDREQAKAIRQLAGKQGGQRQCLSINTNLY